MNIILFDFNDTWENLLPITYTRPISEIRVGILTIKEKWDKMFSETCSYLTKAYLQEKVKTKYADENLYVNSFLIPDSKIVNKLNSLNLNQLLIVNGTIAGFKSEKKIVEVNSETFHGLEKILASILLLITLQ